MRKAAVLLPLFIFKRLNILVQLPRHSIKRVGYIFSRINDNFKVIFPQFAAVAVAKIFISFIKIRLVYAVPTYKFLNSPFRFA